ncbi:MAG TPA: DUF2339 domain-containing protein [Sphingomonas sp.]
MSNLVLIGLIVALVLLWRRVEALAARVGALEFAPATPQAWVAEPAAPPAPVEDEARTEAPRPSALPAPRPEPAAIEPEPFPESVMPDVASGSINFEDLLGRRLAVWAGGVTLAVTGFLLVKYSIDRGLLSPVVRVILGLVFGAGLIGGAEAALRRSDLVRDPRIAQALGGAGVATLYGVVLAAANLYGLIGPGAAFVGMATVTLLAGGLALRFGAPSALLGLVGGLAAPALVGAGEPDVPLLTGYLALTVGGLCALGRSRGWSWLAAAALTGGFGWGLVLLSDGALDRAASLSLGLFTLLLAVGLPVASFGREQGTAIRLLAALAGCAQMAALVGTGGFTALDWSLFGLLSAALVWLSRREEPLRPLAPAALAVNLLLIAAWPAPAPLALALVIAVAAVIHAGSAAFDLWRARGRVVDAVRVAAVALAVPALPLLHLQPAPGALALLALLGAAPAAALAALGRRRNDDARFAVLSGAAAALLVAAGVAIAPERLDPHWAALVSVGLLFVGRAAQDGHAGRTASAFVAAALTWLLAEPLVTWTAGAVGAPFGEPLLVTALPAPADALPRIATAGLALLVAARGPGDLRRPALVAAGALAAVAAHLAYKQLFALASPADFVAFGLAERTVWQTTLALLALAMRRHARTAALAVGAAGLAHFGWFTVVLHNPLWADQAVGAWPVLNLLLSAYGVALLLLVAAGREAVGPELDRARHWAIMAVVPLFAISMVRQVAAGSLLTRGGVGDAENIAYSLAAVALAIGYLRYGIAKPSRDWRVASLLLMLAAVAKVFGHDAAGLDGLARIASFAALGFSLLGLGWLYSRFLPEPAR